MMRFWHYYCVKAFGGPFLLQPPTLPPNIYVVWCGGYEDCVNVSPQHISQYLHPSFITYALLVAADISNGR